MVLDRPFNACDDPGSRERGANRRHVHVFRFDHPKAAALELFGQLTFVDEVAGGGPRATPEKDVRVPRRLDAIADSTPQFAETACPSIVQCRFVDEPQLLHPRISRPHRPHSEQSPIGWLMKPGPTFKGERWKSSLLG